MLTAKTDRNLTQEELFNLYALERYNEKGQNSELTNKILDLIRNGYAGAIFNDAVANLKNNLLFTPANFKMLSELP